MLSSEHPSGPSCSSKSAGPGVTADPATSAAEASACQDPRDLVQPFPKFSIRDYVFTSRSKSVKRSWPFHPNSLQLCLKRGVKDPLPPFEPPDLVRSQPFNTFTGAERSAACSGTIACVGLVKTRDVGSSNVHTGDINIQFGQETVDELSLGPSPCTSPENGKSGIDQVGSTTESDHTDGAIPVDLRDNSCTKASRRAEFGAPSWRSRNLDSSREPSEKKSKFVVKVGILTDIRRTEDIASNSSSVSDPMASKTCPVCKVFASTSNTTLNAHIDQCLSVESTTELVETVLVKPKVKPKKKRLMVDIYKTALPYTLEDLDRRNGTNWAIELAMSTVNKEVCTENQSPEVIPLDPRDDEREGDVYVDSNGIKIRILSKCSDSPLVLRDEFCSSKVANHEAGRDILTSKKISKCNTILKKKKTHGKKYNKSNHFNSQVQAYPHEGINEGTSEGEMHMRNPTEGTSNCGSGPMRQWVSSKRSDVSKGGNRKLGVKTFDKVISGAQKLPRSSVLGFDDSQIPERPTGGFSSQSLEEIVSTSTSEANGVEQSNSPSGLLKSIPKWSSKIPLQSNVIPKVPRSAAAIAKRKIREIGRREANKSDNYDIMWKSTSVKSSEARSLSFSSAGPNDRSNGLASTSKKFRKQRSAWRTGRRAFSPGSVHGFDQDHEPDTRYVKKKFRVTSSGAPKKFVKHTEEDTADNDFSFGSDMPVSDQQDDQHNMVQQTESTQMDYEGEDPEPDMPYASVSGPNADDCCNEITYGSLSPGNNRSTDDVLVESNGAAVEDPSFSEQLAHHCHESNSVVNTEMEECQQDPTSTKESSACLTNYRDIGPGAPQDDSSITSNREDSSREHGLTFERDSRDSPISTASTMSPTLKDLRTKEHEPGLSSVRTFEDQTSGSLNQETKSMPMPREGEELPNEKSCCCSCRESISRMHSVYGEHEESQSRHQNAPARPILNFSGKQVRQLHIGLTAASSFSTYQRTGTKANPFLDLHDEPLVAKVSVESATNLPSYTAECMSPSLQSQLPSPSNPILRLMGKNLMVMNNEESVHPQVPNSDYTLRGNYVAPVGFLPPNYQHFNDSAFINTVPATVSRQIPLSSVEAGNFVGPPLQSGSLMHSDYHSQQKSYKNLVPVMHHPTYMMKEVIVINDSPERRSDPQVSMLHPPTPSPAAISVPSTMPQRPFYCYPSSSPILPRERAAASLPVFANVGSMVGVSSSSQGRQTEISNPYMPNPFFSQSQTGYINQQVYYSQNLR